MACGAHLVGALAFRSAEESFRKVATTGGAAFGWIPDGEPGDRACWTGSPDLHRILGDTDGLVVAAGGLDSVATGAPIPDCPLFALAPGASPEDVVIKSFGLGKAAVESYAEFRRLKDEGIIAKHIRFQVSMPSAFGMLMCLIEPASHEALAPNVTRATLGDLQIILDAAPHKELAIQWDVAPEVGFLEAMADDALLDRLCRELAQLGDAVPPQVELGYHLCYGAPFDEHLVEPKDAGLMVRMSNSIAHHLKRPLQRIHLPVPIARDDAAYYAPFADLNLPKETKLYLGLLHCEDGVEGATRRIAAAKMVLPEFGVAAECGTARTRVDPVDMLKLHVDALDVIDRGAFKSVTVPREAHDIVPSDREEVDARLREWGARVPCHTCGAGVGEPCKGNFEVHMYRPHQGRYVNAVRTTFARN